MNKARHCIYTARTEKRSKQNKKEIRVGKRRKAEEMRIN
jgi:hypothetical protein